MFLFRILSCKYMYELCRNLYLTQYEIELSECVCVHVCIGDELYDHHIICAIIVALRLVCHSQSNVFVPTAHTHTHSEQKKKNVYSCRKQYTNNVYDGARVVSECEKPRFMYHSRTALSRVWIERNRYETPNVNEQHCWQCRCRRCC